MYSSTIHIQTLKFDQMCTYHHQTIYRNISNNNPNIQNPRYKFNVTSILISWDEHDKLKIFIKTNGFCWYISLNKLLLFLQCETIKKNLPYPCTTYNIQQILRYIIFRSNNIIFISKLLRIKSYWFKIRFIIRQTSKCWHVIQKIIFKYGNIFIFSYITIYCLYC